MLSWIAANIGTIIITALLLAVVCGVTAKLISDKRKGKGSCGCGCENCAMSSACHGKK